MALTVKKIPFVKGSALLALEGEQTELGEQSIEDLVDTIEKYIPDPVRDTDKPFLMYIKDTDTKTGLGTIVMGNPLRGRIKKLQEVAVVGLTDSFIATVTGTQSYKKDIEEVIPGDEVGLLLRGVKRERVRRGQAVAAIVVKGTIKEATIKAWFKFKASAYILTKEEGGRHKSFTGGNKEGGRRYRPQFHFNSANVTGSISSATNPQTGEKMEMIMPGDSVNFEVELAKPVALEVGTNFIIRESKMTVGEGTVLELIKLKTD